MFGEELQLSFTNNLKKEPPVVVSQGFRVPFDPQHEGVDAFASLPHKPIEQVLKLVE